MKLTAQFAAHTPKPSEAITVEKRTNVATNAFKFGPSLILIKYAFYSNLRVALREPRSGLPYSSRVDAARC